MEADRFETVQKGTILSFFILFLTVILIIHRGKKLATLTLVNEKCVHMHISFLYKFAEDFAASVGHSRGPPVRQFDIFLKQTIGIGWSAQVLESTDPVQLHHSKQQQLILCKHTK